jgi:hypothetical protein
MKHTLMKQGLVVFIILLFISVAVGPIINGNTIPQAIGDVPITILEYKADGTVKRTVFRMSHEQADSFHEEMKNIQDLDTRLSIYKKYNLISQNVTVDSLRTGIREKGQRMGLTRNILMSLSSFRIKRSLFPPPPNVYKNINCTVYGHDDVWYGFYWPPLILYLIFGINYLIRDCPFYSKGELGEISLSYADLIILIGFDGIVDMGYHNSWRWIHYSGFCECAIALDNWDNNIKELIQILILPCS